MRGIFELSQRLGVPKAPNKSFVKLLKVPSVMDLLANDEKVQLMAEYATLHQNAITAVTF